MIRPCVFADEISKDFAEAVRRCVEAGAREIELRGGIWGRNVANCTYDDMRRMSEVLERFDARVACIASPVGKCELYSEEEYERHLRCFERMCELAHALGVTLIRGFAFWNPQREQGRRPNLERYLPDIARKLRPIIETAEREGVCYCLETEPATMTGTCAEVRVVLEALGESPALGVVWDVRNGLAAGEVPFPDGYQLIRGYVRHMHIKPNSQKNMSTVGDTELRYAEVFRAVLADGFDGCASIEHWGSPELMLDGVRQLNEMLARLEPPGAG